MSQQKVEFSEGKNRFQMDVSDFPTGMYFVTFEWEGVDEIRQKFVMVK